MPDTKSVIQDILVAHAAALSRKDAPAACAYLSDDTVSFDLAPPLQSHGPQPQDLKAWFDTWQGPIELEQQQLHISHGEEVALARDLESVQKLVLRLIRVAQELKPGARQAGEAPQL